MASATGVASGGGSSERNGRDQDEQLESPLDFKILRRIFSYMGPYAAKRNLVFLMTACRAFLRPANALLLGWIISDFITHGDYRMTVWGTLGYAVLALLTEYTQHLRQRHALEMGEFVVRDLRKELYEHLQILNMDFYNKTKLGSILSRVISDMETVRRGLQNVFFFGLLLLGMMFWSGIAMLWVSPQLFLLLVLIAPVLAFINRFFHKRISKYSRLAQRSQSRITGNVAETVKGIQVIQSYTQENRSYEGFNRLVAENAENNVNLGYQNALFVPLLEFNGQAFLALLLALGGYGIISGWEGMQVGDVLTFFFLANFFFTPIQNLARIYTVAVVSMAGAERLFDILDTQPSWKHADSSSQLGVVSGHVSFRNVSFEYVKGSPVLYGLSLDIQPGQTVALVGHTGSGKSTIINLVSKFYLPTAGSVLIDGKDIGQMDTASVRQQLGIVLQNNFLFSGTVYENIRLGKPGASDADIRAAASSLDCLDLLENMPDGLETEVGELGKSVSQGQRQLICFTRAMLADPRILILDEATSAIDTITESRLQIALEKLLSGRTSIVIAHRLSTISKADEIFVLNQGRLAESGSHLELLEMHGHYYELYRQFVSLSDAEPAA
ncbi:MAG: ABC transporter ATP-binding protein [Opitutales bacterium]|nr:ABC transporter ATP-binding protein [Opitutales bacterium]